MLPKAICIRKTVEDRLHDYFAILGQNDIVCSDISVIWAHTLDIILSVTGWQGLWVFSEDDCIKYNLMHPNCAIVSVKGYAHNTLTAVVNAVGAQDDILLPSLVEVPLIDIYPIENQEFDQEELLTVADWLDKLRYFFKNLWYPWDAKENVTMSEWCHAHLNNRLRLQHDLKLGNFGQVTSKYIMSLLKEAKELDIAFKNMPLENLSETEKTSLVSKHIRRKVVKLELALFEEHELRPSMIELRCPEQCKIDLPKLILVWPGSSFSSMMDYIKMCKEESPDDNFTEVTTSLEEAAEKCDSRDLVFVPPGKHYMKSTLKLLTDGTIKGLGESPTITLMPNILRKSFLLECVTYVKLCNLTFTRDYGITIQVFNGTLDMINCNIQSKGTAARGIVVLSSCKLTLDSCKLDHLQTAIQLHKETVASFSNCSITNCRDGIQISDNCLVSMRSVEISSCKNYGIRVETCKNMDEIMVGSAEQILTKEIMSSMKIMITIDDSSKICSNLKGDVIIKQVSDYFSDSEDEGSEESDDDDEINGANINEVSIEEVASFGPIADVTNLEHASL